MTDPSATTPYPPFDLRNRVGFDGSTEEEDVARYEEIGRRCADHIARILPEDWTWEGKRVLDFGCGAGRTLRHFLGLPASTELYGCDLHSGSIEWMREHLPARLQVFANEVCPPLDVPDGHFDLVYALSVFTHINEEWAPWMLEMQRVLAPGGLLLATFLGPAMWDWLVDEQLEEDEVGMISCKNSFVEGDFSLPDILHSDWWLERHWGTLFSVKAMADAGFAAEENDGLYDAVLPEPSLPARDKPSHGWALLERRDVHVSAPELEEPDWKDQREYRSVVAGRRIAQREARSAGRQLSEVSATAVARDQRIQQLEQQVQRLDLALTSCRAELDSKQAEFDLVHNSRWWRLRARLDPAVRAVRALERTIRNTR